MALAPPHSAHRSGWLLAVLLMTSSVSAEPPPHTPAALTNDAPKPPFKRRARYGVEGMHGKGAGLIDLSRWQKEPESPPAIEKERFAKALGQLCTTSSKADLLGYAGWMLDYGAKFQVDPFLIAALLYRQSRCEDRSDSDYGIGLAKIHPRMHGSHIKKGVYHYHVLKDGKWQPRQLKMDQFKFLRGSLLKAQSNIYFASALLAVHRAQCPANDGSFGSVPHRHYISHFTWGDQVRGAGSEDRVLQARRRLLEYYATSRPHSLLRYEGLAIHCPIDGAPRKLSGVWGEDRDGGRRRHKGIDFSSSTGEPVRAIADGRVAFAGLDRRRGSGKRLSPAAALRVKPSRMGPGGLFVMVDHPGGLRSAYMHLSSYSVRSGDRVKGGQLLGRVGRSGIKDSGAHLHFELRKDGRHIDPYPLLKPYVIELGATWRGRKIQEEEQRVRKRRKRKKRRRARTRKR